MDATIDEVWRETWRLVFLHGVKRINDMNYPKFISVQITEKTGVVSTKFLNTYCIQTVWQDNVDIIIELTDYTKLRLCNQNIDIFMDRFK